MRNRVDSRSAGTLCGPSNKGISVAKMISTVSSTIEARQAKWGKHAINPTGPLFTFLIGAGFSVTAGVSSVHHLVVALEKFASNPKMSWQNIFDATLDVSYNSRRISGTELTDYYFDLMREVLPLPPARHDFITAAMQWASARQVQMNLEGIMLAAVLMAGTGNQVPFDMNNVSRHWLAHAFARHAFTTNFDDLMIRTFQYGNQPVEVIDTPCIRTITPAAEYPTVVYLHGRHMHFDIRNTPQELQMKHQDKGKTGDLFDQFRDLLRTTGLIVIGYAGAMDMVTETIREAAEDPNSLPYGLWWSAFRNEDYLHKEARDIIENTERAFYLDPGKDAEQIMRDMCSEIGIDEAATISGWSRQTRKVSLEIDNFLKRASFNIQEFMMNAGMALLSQSGKEIDSVLEEWQRIQSAAIDHADKEFVADLLSTLGRLMVMNCRIYDGEATLQNALDLHVKTGEEDKVANDLLELAEIHVLRGLLDEAERETSEAMSIYARYKIMYGLANACRLLGDILLRRGFIDEAEMNYKKSLEISQGAKYEHGVAHSLKRLGDLCVIKCFADEARSYYEEAREIHANDGDGISESADIRGIGDVFFMEGKYDLAEKKYGEALQIDEQIDNKRGVAYDLLSLARIKVTEGVYEPAQQLIDRSASCFKEITDVSGELESLRLSGLYLAAAGKKDEAACIMAEAYQRAERTGFSFLAGLIDRERMCL
jgi:tetratricopeptide (TPR) repeat protein